MSHYIIRSHFALPDSHLSMADDSTLIAAVKRALDLSPTGRIEITRADPATGAAKADDSPVKEK